MTLTLKRQLLKLREGTQLKWINILPIVLIRIRITRRVREGVSPFEIWSRKPYPARSLETCSGQMRNKGEGNVKKLLAASLLCFIILTQVSRSEAPLPLDSWCTTASPAIWWFNDDSKPGRMSHWKWTGPLLVLLATHTVVKVEGLSFWIHYTRVKKAPLGEQQSSEPTRNLKPSGEQDCRSGSTVIWDGLHLGLGTSLHRTRLPSRTVLPLFRIIVFNPYRVAVSLTLSKSTCTKMGIVNRALLSCCSTTRTGNLGLQLIQPSQRICNTSSVTVYPSTPKSASSPLELGVLTLIGTANSRP